MNSKQLVDAALHLDPAQRAVLAQSLWESLDAPYLDSDGSDDAALELAVQRDQEIESGAVQALSHDELMHRLRASEG